MLFKFFKYNFYLFIIIITFILSYRFWQTLPLLKELNEIKKEIINNQSNPLGIDKIIYMHRFYLSKNVGEAQIGDYLGYIVAYKTNKDISQIVLNSNGEYLNNYFGDKDVANNHNRFSLWISNKDGINCRISNSDYHWQNINTNINFLVKYAHLNKRYYDIEPWIKLINTSEKNTNYDKKSVYPFWLLTNNKNIIISSKTYFYFQINRDKMYIYFFDPINHLYIVSMSESQIPNIFC